MTPIAAGIDRGKPTTDRPNPEQNFNRKEERHANRYRIRRRDISKMGHHGSAA